MARRRRRCRLKEGRGKSEWRTPCESGHPNFSGKLPSLGLSLGLTVSLSPSLAFSLCVSLSSHSAPVRRCSARRPFLDVRVTVVTVADGLDNSSTAGVALLVLSLLPFLPGRVYVECARPQRFLSSLSINFFSQGEHSSKKQVFKEELETLGNSFSPKIQT